MPEWETYEEWLQIMANELVPGAPQLDVCFDGEKARVLSEMLTTVRYYKYLAFHLKRAVAILQEMPDE